MDEFSTRYAGLLTGSYDCVDRIVLNAYYPLGHNPGGFRGYSHLSVVTQRVNGFTPRVGRRW